MELFLIFAQACDWGRRHRKARVGDTGHCQEMERWESKSQGPMQWAFTENF